MSYNKKELIEKITAASRIAFKKILEEKPNEDFFSFVLLTVDDVLSCYAYANSTESHLKTMLTNNIATNSKEEAYYKWAPVEWEYSTLSREEFDPVYFLSEKIQDELSEDSFYKYKMDFIDCMETTLGQLDQEGIFGTGEKRNKITLFTTISDSFSTDEVEDHSSKRLNSLKVFENFKTRFK